MIKKNQYDDDDLTERGRMAKKQKISLQTELITIPSFFFPTFLYISTVSNTYSLGRIISIPRLSIVGYGSGFCI